MIEGSRETIEGFLDRLASDAPVPGGGSAAALAVALAAALVAMVCRVTRKREPDVPVAMQETARDAEGLKASALRLGAEDSEAYAGVLQARRRPLAERPTAVAHALKRATDVPVATARAGRDVLAAGRQAALHARSSVLNDLGVAAILASAGLEAGVTTARSNLAEVEDRAYVTQTLQALARLVDDGATLRRQLDEVLAERHEPDTVVTPGGGTIMADAKGPTETRPRKKITIPMLEEKKKKKEPITMLAVYDYPTSIIADRIGIDVLCTSDTGGMILFGHETTETVSYEEVLFMTQGMARGAKYGLRMTDMPYMSYHYSEEQAIRNAARFVSEGRAEVMKCEGNRHHAKFIGSIVRAGIPVMGHIGITPMRVAQLGGFSAQGKTAERAQELVDDARAMVDAGCFSILCEVTTSEVCQYLAETLPVPVISLGAGNKADGVHIITSDLFKFYDRHTPRHSKVYMEIFPVIQKVLQAYHDDVVSRQYPGPEHTVFMKEEELKRFRDMVSWH